VILLGLDIKMFYGGPKEAVMHSIYRQNLGFTDIVIGRKHADAPYHDGTSIWGDFDAQEIFGALRGDLRIQPLKVGFAAYYESIGRVDLTDNHPGEKPVSISGKDVRKALLEGARSTRASFDRARRTSRRRWAGGSGVAAASACGGGEQTERGDRLALRRWTTARLGRGGGAASSRLAGSPALRGPYATTHATERRRGAPSHRRAVARAVIAAASARPIGQPRPWGLASLQTRWLSAT
jgi:hypothetical protein